MNPFSCVGVRMYIYIQKLLWFQTHPGDDRKHISHRPRADRTPMVSSPAVLWELTMKQRGEKKKKKLTIFPYGCMS